jgi:hypothetical protein
LNARLRRRDKSAAVGRAHVAGVILVLSFLRNALAIRFAQDIKHRTIRAPSVPGCEQDRLPRSGPDQRRSVKAVAGRATASRLKALTDRRCPARARQAVMAQRERNRSRFDRATDDALGRFWPPAARSLESTGSLNGRAAGCWRDVSFSPPKAPTRHADICTTFVVRTSATRRDHQP